MSAGRACPLWPVPHQRCPTEQPAPPSHAHCPSGSPWDRTQQIILIFPLLITVTTLPTRMFSFMGYCEIFVPIPIILRGLMIFSIQSFLPPFIIRPFLLFTWPQNPTVLEPGPVHGFCREGASLNHETRLYSGLCP